MSSRIFQSVILQMKDCTKLPLGVVDGEGAVVACTDLSMVGERWPHVVEAINRHDSAYVNVDGKTFRPLSGWSTLYDYACFIGGEGEEAQSLCGLATVPL